MLLKEFEQSVAPGVWPTISKAQLISDMSTRMQYPQKVYQSYTPLCGPSAIVYELVRKHPDRYVQICRNLFEQGEFTVSGQTARASDNLRSSQVRTGMSPVDWMLMTTMREDENALFTELDDGSWDIALGITTPWEIKGWAKNLLNYDNVEFESSFLFGELDALQSAHVAVAQGGVAFLLVSGDLIKDGEAGSIPDHWVTYVGGLDIGGERVRFQCQTWGKLRNVDVEEEEFDDGMWGAVLAR